MLLGPEVTEGNDRREWWSRAGSRGEWDERREPVPRRGSPRGRGLAGAWGGHTRAGVGRAGSGYARTRGVGRGGIHSAGAGGRAGEWQVITNLP